MDKIKQVNSIFQIARSHITNKNNINSTAKSKKTSKSTNKKNKKLSISELKTSIFKKVKNLDNTDSDYSQQVQKIFLESVLIREFGEELANDPDFHEMINKINDSISKDTESSLNFSNLVKQLTIHS